MAGGVNVGTPDDDGPLAAGDEAEPVEGRAVDGDGARLVPERLGARHRVRLQTRVLERRRALQMATVAVARIGYGRGTALIRSLNAYQSLSISMRE